MTPVPGLVQRVGEVEAVRGLDFDVAPGEIFSFLGPNGAGKSTTIAMLCTALGALRRLGERRRPRCHC